jgi:hypothetical protein
MARAKGVSGGKSLAKLAGAISAAEAMSPPSGTSPMPPGPPQSLPGPSPMAGNGGPPPPMPMPVSGAADGLGAGAGGLALHPSVKAAKIGGYEPRHTSKHR